LLIKIIFFIQHLFINFLSSFWIFNNAKYFISFITFYHNLRGIKYIEIIFIAIPFILHALIGLKYMIGRRYSFKSDKLYDQQKAYVLQKITAWILIIGILLHVLQMRFINHPATVTIDNQKYFALEITKSEKLSKIAKKLDFKILDNTDVNKVSFVKVHLTQRETKLKSNRTYALVKNPSKALLVVIINNFQSKVMVFLYRDC